MANKVKNVKIITEEGRELGPFPIGANAENIDTNEHKNLQIKVNEFNNNKTEVESARGGYQKLKDRLDNLDFDCKKKKLYVFNTIQDMQRTDLKISDYCRVFGNQKINDIAGQDFIISIKDEKINQIPLENGLYASYIDDYPLKTLNYPYKNHFLVKGSRITGDSFGEKFKIFQNKDAEETIQIKYNENIVENLYLSNEKKYTNKIGINILEPSQHNLLQNIKIVGDYKIGVKSPASYYSIFRNIWTYSKIGMDIGKTDGWIGVLDIDSCHFNYAQQGFIQRSKDSNTIVLNKCSLEHTDQAIENYGRISFLNGYIGDQDNNENQHCCFRVHDNSETLIENSSLGLSIPNNSEANTCIDFRNAHNAIVKIKNCTLGLGNDNLYDGTVSGLYNIDNDSNTLYLDDCFFNISQLNKNHGAYPFILSKYNCLKSLNPIQNYIINGNLKNLQLLHLQNPLTNIESELKNPFGGAVIHNRMESSSVVGVPNIPVTFYYKIPKEFINKKMVLEGFLSSTSQALALKSEDFKDFNTWYPGVVYYPSNQVNKPFIFRKEVIPLKETGQITIFIHWNEKELKDFSISGLVLKPLEYKRNISCYKSDNNYSMEKPNYKSLKNEIIYSLDPIKTKCLGWIFNGSSWQEINYI